MDLQKANQIVDAVALVMEEHGGTKFTPLSKVGASNRLEIIHALYLVTAETFWRASTLGRNRPDSQKILETFITAAGASAVRVIYTFLPDSELEVISRMTDPMERRKKAQESDLNELRDSAKWYQETTRLNSLAMSDGLMKTETIDSFVSYLKTLNLVEIEFWPAVYQRIGLDCPTYFRSAKTSLPSTQNKPWWRFW